jgi:hypothetical protein
MTTLKPDRHGRLPTPSTHERHANGSMTMHTFNARYPARSLTGGEGRAGLVSTRLLPPLCRLQRIENSTEHKLDCVASHAAAPYLPVMTGVVDWVGGVTAAVGSVAAAGALVVGAVTLRRQTDQTRREQARKISAFVQEQPTPEHGPVVRVLNSSDQPIYDVAVITVDARTGQILSTITEFQGDVGMLPPGQYEDTVPASAQRESQGPPVVAEVTFTDSAGRTWRRDRRGQLNEHRAR